MTKLRGMVLGAFLGDALALGPHWIYNMEDIKKNFGRIEELTSPVTNYHEGKTKGDFTHYGDQALMMFQYMKLNKVIEKEQLYNHYQSFMNSYKGYKDHATKETLENLERDVYEGSHSNELGGYVRFPGVIYFNPKIMDVGLNQILLQTSMTHNSEVLLDRVTFLVKLQYAILKGERPSQAIEKLLNGASKQIKLDFESAKKVMNYPTSQAMKQLGQSCDSNYAFPAVMYFVMKYEDMFEEALIENVMAGGDSAARGMVIGGLLGAYHGDEELPLKWIASMNQLKTIENLMKS